VQKWSKSFRNDFTIDFLKNVVLYEIYSVKSRVTNTYVHWLYMFILHQTTTNLCIYAPVIVFISIFGFNWSSSFRGEDFLKRLRRTDGRTPSGVKSSHGLWPGGKAMWAKKSALDSQPQVIKFTSCLPRVGGSLLVLRLPPSLNLFAMT
jgi:hypothetical protein